MKLLEQPLSGYSVFEGMSQRHLRQVAGCAKNARFDAGKYLFRAGNRAEHFYLIHKGKVAVELNAPGGDPLTIETLGEGATLGWSWLFPPNLWRFDARAVEPTRVIVLDGKCLRGKIEGDHDLGYEFFQRFSRIIVQRLEATRFQLLDVYGSRH